MDALRGYAGRADELLHLAVRYMDAVESRRVTGRRLVGAVELWEPRRAGAPVEVRRAEHVGRLGPERVERSEVARQEHDLAARRPRPGRRTERVARLAGDRRDECRVVVERPAEVVAEDEET